MEVSDHHMTPRCWIIEFYEDGGSYSRKHLSTCLLWLAPQYGLCLRFYLLPPLWHAGWISYGSFSPQTFIRAVKLNLAIYHGARVIFSLSQGFSKCGAWTSWGRLSSSGGHEMRNKNEKRKTNCNHLANFTKLNRDKIDRFLVQLWWVKRVCFLWWPWGANHYDINENTTLIKTQQH